MELNWNFQRGGEVLRKIPSVGEVWIFSGITQCNFNFVIINGSKHQLEKAIIQHHFRFSIDY